MPVYVVSCAKARLRFHAEKPFEAARVVIAAPDAGRAIDEFEVMYDRAAPAVASEKGLPPVTLLVAAELEFPPLSLAEWCAKWGMIGANADADTVNVIPPLGPTELPTWELYRLTDYRVSSRSGPVVWLAKKPGPPQVFYVFCDQSRPRLANGSGALTHYAMSIAAPDKAQAEAAFRLKYECRAEVSVYRDNSGAFPPDLTVPGDVKQEKAEPEAAPVPAYELGGEGG